MKTSSENFVQLICFEKDCHSNGSNQTHKIQSKYWHGGSLSVFASFLCIISDIFKKNVYWNLMSYSRTNYASQIENNNSKSPPEESVTFQFAVLRIDLFTQNRRKKQANSFVSSINICMHVLFCFVLGFLFFFYLCFFFPLFC